MECKNEKKETLYEKSHTFADKSFVWNEENPRIDIRGACTFGYENGYKQAMQDLIKLINTQTRDMRI